MWMRLLRICLMIVLLGGAAISMTGCATTEQDGVIIEQRRWWHIFSEAEPAPDAAEEPDPVPS